MAFVCILLLACDSQTAGKGAGLNLPELKGQWVLINYWAEWCKPCLQEIPELNAFARDQAGKVRVFGVNFDGVEGEALKALVQKFDIQFTVLETDPASSLELSRPEVLPATFVIDPEGRIAQRLIGPQTREDLERVTALK